MNKLLLSVILSLFCIGTVFSQFDPQFSQYMFNLPSYNPAAVGEGDLIQVVGQHRIQWMDTTMAFGANSTNFGINSPIRINGTHHGIGLRFQRDQIGLFNNQSVYLQYAYKYRLLGGVLSAGLDLGYLSVGFQGTKVDIPDIDDYHTLLDDAVPKTDVSGSSVDVNLGLLYSNPQYYVGLSFLHLMSPTVAWGDTYEYHVRGTTFLTAGYNYMLPDKKVVIKPTALLKTDYSSLQFDLSGRLEYDNKFWGGMTYRMNELAILAGVNVEGGLSIGFSYDIPTSKVISVSWGTAEIMMSYNFAYVFEKRNTKYKSIRIL